MGVVMLWRVIFVGKYNFFWWWFLDLVCCWCKGLGSLVFVRVFWNCLLVGGSIEYYYIYIIDGVVFGLYVNNLWFSGCFVFGYWIFVIVSLLF